MVFFKSQTLGGLDREQVIVNVLAVPKEYLWGGILNNAPPAGQIVSLLCSLIKCPIFVKEFDVRFGC